MDYVDIAFPDEIAMGAQSAVQWQTSIAMAAGGSVSANQDWEDPLHPFDVGFAIRTVSDFAAVKAHFMAVRGRAKAFPFKDYTDFTVLQAEGKLLDADGVAPTADGTFYLFKRYGSTGSFDRRIRRPDATPVIYRTRAAVTSVITPTITLAGGSVALTGHVAGDTYAWAGTFKLACRYDTDRLPAVIVNREGSPGGELLVQCSGLPVVEVRNL